MPYPPGTKLAPATACAWEPLATTRLASLPRGAVLRVPGAVATEPSVDLLLVEHRDAPSGWALLVATGHKAGLVRQELPREARDAAGAVSVAWLRSAWQTWIDEASTVDQVRVAAGYDTLG